MERSPRSAIRVQADQRTSAVRPKMRSNQPTAHASASSIRTARAAGKGARVSVAFVVGADGVPRDFGVASSTDAAFDRATLGHHRLRFTPGTTADRPVKTWVELPIQWSPAEAGFRALYRWRQHVYLIHPLYAVPFPHPLQPDRPQ